MNLNLLFFDLFLFYICKSFDSPCPGFYRKANVTKFYSAFRTPPPRRFAPGPMANRLGNMKFGRPAATVNQGHRWKS